MDTAIDHEKYLLLLEKSDQDLLLYDIAFLKNKIDHATNFQIDGLWTRDLLTYISAIPVERIFELEWTTEKYYAAKLRDPCLLNFEDYFYLIGYNRVIGLRMCYTTLMGHTLEDADFAICVLSKHYQKRLSSSIRIIEIGCGAGELLANLVVHGYTQVCGIDISSAAVRVARARLLKECLGQSMLILDCIHCVSLEDYASTIADYYDVVIHADVIEHIHPHHMTRFLANIRKILKPQGFMIVITPSKLTGPHDSTRRFAVPGSEPLGFHLRELYLLDLIGILSEAGFEHFETVGSLPSLNNHLDSLSSENIQSKLKLETYLRRETIELNIKQQLVDSMYFRGLVCQLRN